MKGHIKYYSFGSLLKKVIDNRGRTCPTAKTGLPLIATNCIKNDHIYPVIDNIRFVDQETYKNWFRGHPEPGDMLFVLKGTPGRVAWVPDPVNFCIAQDMVAIRVNKKKIYPKYLFAVLRSPQIQQEIEGLHVGTLIPHFKKGDFDSLQIPCVEDKIQKYIGDIYFFLSQKIDQLHHQNATLEAMAEALFRKWFVVEAKEEWANVTIGDVIEIKGGSTPSTKCPELWGGLIHWSSPRDIAGSSSPFMFSTERKITEKGLEKISSGLLPVGTLLLSSRAPIGYLAITDIEVAINQGYIAILPNKLISNFYMYLWCKYNMEEIKAAGNGSVFQEISKSVFRQLQFVLPPKKLLADFNILISSCFEKIRFNQTQILTLEKLRDTLLPKLMSGEVRVAY